MLTMFTLVLETNYLHPSPIHPVRKPNHRFHQSIKLLYLECICTEDYSPVCAEDGVQYSNACDAGCKNKTVQCTGECPCASEETPELCICTANFDPICGEDGVQYSNACDAGCKNVTVQCSGECPCTPEDKEEQCICTFVYKPECGVDGVTYSNSCQARCKNVAIAYPGACNRPN